MSLSLYEILGATRADADRMRDTEAAERLRHWLDRRENTMPLMVGDNAKEYHPAPEGLHVAVCCDVIDVGLQDTPWGKKQKLKIRWQLEDKNEETGKRYVVTKQYTASLNEKANLSQDLESWRGKKFSAEERKGFDVEKLIGACCQLQVVHNITDNATYANVQAVVPLGKGMTKIRVEDYVREQDRTENGDHPNAPGAGDEDLPF